MNTSATDAQAFATYRYHGPISGVTLRVGDTEYEIMLFPESDVEMPEQHEYTQTPLALGLLSAQATNQDAA